jgi:hypothetical protein
MVKFFKTTTKDNRKKDFTQVDTSTSRGIGRFGSPSGSAVSSGPRVVVEREFVMWGGVVATWDGALGYWRENG